MNSEGIIIAVGGGGSAASFVDLTDTPEAAYDGGAYGEDAVVVADGEGDLGYNEEWGLSLAVLWAAFDGATDDLALFYIDGDGEIAAGNPPALVPAIQTLTIDTEADPDEVDWDCSLGHGKVTLTSSCTLNNATNVIEGAEYRLVFVQDGTGGRVVTFSANYILNGTLTVNTAIGGRTITTWLGRADGKLELIGAVKYNS